MTSLVNKTLHKLFMLEASPERLVFSLCVGMYIAISPFIFLHTGMIFLCAWLFDVNFPLTFAVVHTVNNPWTMLPIYSAAHAVGSLVLAYCGFAGCLQGNPQMVENLICYVRPYCHVDFFSFWAFMIGGNLLALFISGMLYPIIMRIIVRTNQENINSVIVQKHENYCEK